MDKKESIIRIIKETWSNDDIIRVWNNYCNETDMDEYIWENDEYTLDDMFGGCDHPVDSAIRACFYGDYRYGDKYVRFNGYGNLVSFDWWDDDYSPIDLDTIADFLIGEGDSDVEVDTEELESDFLQYMLEFENDLNLDFVRSIIDEIIEEETFDLLTEDWADLKDSVWYKLEKESRSDYLVYHDDDNEEN